MGPEAKPGLSLTEGKLVLNAVSGNPGAAYFTIVNNSEKAVTFVASHIEGAGRSEMHGPLGEHRTMLAIENLVIGPHSRMVFEPGKYHVMAFEIGADIVAGGNTEITLTSADGDKISAPLKIEAMGGMDHGSGH